MWFPQAIKKVILKKRYFSLVSDFERLLSTIIHWLSARCLMHRKYNIVSGRGLLTYEKYSTITFIMFIMFLFIKIKK